MPLLLETNDPEILATVKMLLAEDRNLSPKMLSAFLQDIGIDMSPQQAGWWLRRTRAFRKRRSNSGALWTPIPSRLRRLYEQFGFYHQVAQKAVR